MQASKTVCYSNKLEAFAPKMRTVLLKLAAQNDKTITKAN